jgi:hypothetical protein
VQENNDPVRRADELREHPLGVWCGDSDVYYDTAHALAPRAQAAVSSFRPRDHADGYRRRRLPAALRLVGDHLC